MSNETALLKVKEILSCLESLSRYSSLESPEDMSAVLELFQKISWRSSEIPLKNKFDKKLIVAHKKIESVWVLLDFLAESILNINALNFNNKKFLLGRLLKESEVLEKILKGYQKFLNRPDDEISLDCGLELPVLNDIVGCFLDQYLIHKIDRAIQDLEAVTDKGFKAISTLRVVEIIGEAASQMSPCLRALDDFPFWAVPTSGGNKSLAHDLRNLIQHHRRELSFMEKLDLARYEAFISQCQQYIALVKGHISKVKKYFDKKHVALPKGVDVKQSYKNIIPTDLFVSLNKFCQRFGKGVPMGADNKAAKGSENKGVQAQDDVKKFKDITAVYFEDLVGRLLREGSEIHKKLAHFLYRVISGETDQDELKGCLPPEQVEAWLASCDCQEVQEFFLQITRRVGFALLQKKGLVVGSEPSEEESENWSVLRKSLQFFFDGALGPIEMPIYTAHELALYLNEKKLYLEPELLGQLKLLYRARINGLKEINVDEELAEIVGDKLYLCQLKSFFNPIALCVQEEKNYFHSVVQSFESLLKALFKDNKVEDRDGKIREKLLYLFCGEQYRNNRAEYDVAVASVLSKVNPIKKYEVLRSFIGLQVDAFKKSVADSFCAHFFVKNVADFPELASSFSLSLHDGISIFRRAIQKLDDLVKFANVAGWSQSHLAAEFFMEEAGHIAGYFYEKNLLTNAGVLELSKQYFGVLAQFRKKMAHHYRGVDFLELQHLLEKSCLITSPLLQGMDMKPGEAVKPLELIDAKDQIIRMILSFGFGFNIRIIGSRAACDFGVQADLNLLVEEIDAESPASAGLLVELSMALGYFLNRDVQVFTEASLRESYKTKVSPEQINSVLSRALGFEDYIESLRYEKIIKEAAAYSNVRMHDGAVLTYRDMKFAEEVKKILKYLFPCLDNFSSLFVDTGGFKEKLKQAVVGRCTQYQGRPGDHQKKLSEFIWRFKKTIIHGLYFNHYDVIYQGRDQAESVFMHHHPLLDPLTDQCFLPRELLLAGFKGASLEYKIPDGRLLFLYQKLEGSIKYKLFDVLIAEALVNIGAKKPVSLDLAAYFVKIFFEEAVYKKIHLMIRMGEPRFGANISSVEFLEAMPVLGEARKRRRAFYLKRFDDRSDLRAIVCEKARAYCREIQSIAGTHPEWLGLMVIYKKIECVLKDYFYEREASLVADYFRMTQEEKQFELTRFAKKDIFCRQVSCVEEFVRTFFAAPGRLINNVQGLLRLYLDFIRILRSLSANISNTNFQIPRHEEFFYFEQICSQAGRCFFNYTYSVFTAYKTFSKLRMAFSLVENPEIFQAFKDASDQSVIFPLVEADFKKAYCSGQAMLRFRAGVQNSRTAEFSIDRTKRGFSDEVECELYEQQKRFVNAKSAEEIPDVLKRVLRCDIALISGCFVDRSQSPLVIHSVVGGVLGFESELDRRLSLIHHQIMGRAELCALNDGISTEEWPKLALNHVDPVIAFEPNVTGKARHRHAKINTLDDLFKEHGWVKYKVSDDQVVIKDYYEYRKKYDQLSALLNRMRQYVSTLETLQKARDGQADMELKEIVGERIMDIQLRCQADLKEYGAVEGEIMDLDYTKKRILLLLQQKPIFEQIERLFAEQPDHHEALFAGFVAQVQWLIRRELDKPEGSDQLSVCEKARLFMPRQPFRISSCDAAMFSSVLETLPCTLELRKTL